MKKLLCALLTLTLLASSAVSVPAAEISGDADAPVLKEGAYAPHQAVVLFKGSVIDTDTVPRKGDLASVGADFGDMMDASSSAQEALSAADEEVAILQKTLGGDFVLEDTLVFDDEADSKAGASVGALPDTAEEELTIALVSSDKYDTATLIQKLSQNPKVAKAEPNYCLQATSLADYSLNDEYASYLYHVNSPAANNTGGDDVDDRGADPETALSVNASSGWEKLTDTDRETVVAVIDSGVLDTHEDLKDVMWTNPGDIGLKGTHGYNFSENKGKTHDTVGHGTHCAGVIAAQANNGKGVAGIASGANVKIMALQTMSGVFGTATAYATYGAYHYIHKAVQGGVNVVAVNNSWGGYNYSDVYDKVIDLIGEDGVLSYIAAGNDGENCDNILTTPGDTDSEYAITVGAADITGECAAFSNYGKASVDVFGTGVNIFSTVSYQTYYPATYTAEKRNATTEFYGEFNADTRVENGKVTPSAGAGAGTGMKTFGEIQFVKQRLREGDDEGADEEPEIADDARLELAVEQGRHFISGNPYRLKVTVKDAQPGEEYFIYFPYEKNALTTGDDNTYFSVSAESVASSTGVEAQFFCGEVSKGEDDRYALTGRKSEYEPGGASLAFTAATHNKIQRHATNIPSPSEAEQGSVRAKLLSADEAQGKELGFGLYVAGNWSEGSHDLSVYLDNLAISKPDAALDENTSYDVMSGTSMACPSVCGGGALFAAVNPRREGESGGDYAKRIRTGVLSCVTQTDALKDLCSTGGYLDLSKIDAEMPAVTDAVCDVENETITLKGENLVEGSTVTYRSLYSDNAQEQALPAEMTVDFADDGKQLVIRNAKSLFSTYTAFTVTKESGVQGTGKFFLVKGQRQLDPVSSEMKTVKDVFVPDEYGGLTRKTEELVPPYLLTDAGGKALYGYFHQTGEIAKFDGKQFNTVKNSDLTTALRDHLQQNGVDPYTAYNDYTMNFVITDVPAHENGVVYVLAQADLKQDGGDDDGDDGDEDPDGDDDPDPDADPNPDDDPDPTDDPDGGEEDPDPTDDPDGGEGGEDIPPEYVDDSWYLGSYDLNSDEPQWCFTGIEAIPGDINVYDNENYLNTVVCNGTLYLTGRGAGVEAETMAGLSVFSLDLGTKKWTQAADLPLVAQSYDLVAANGKLYATFGVLPDESLPTQERSSRSVYCFDGSTWEKKGDVPLLGRVFSYHSQIIRREAVTPVKNGLLFVGVSVDGGGNVFVYNTDTDTVEPLYYTTSDSLSDTYGRDSSCVVTCDGVYYIRQVKDDYKSGWALSLLPADSGAYQDPYATVILGDADGDGQVTVADVTMIQQYLAEYELPDTFQLRAADVDGNGKITIRDATYLQMYLAEMDAPDGIGYPMEDVDELSLWTDTAPLKSRLKSFIKTITNPRSSDFIPVKNRIAVFDMDGTLCCETDPGYFDHKLLYHRVMEDPDYKDQASDEEKAVCEEIEEYFATGSYPGDLAVRHGRAVATAFKGMTPAEFDAYVKAYRETPMASYTNMTNGQAFYKPMLQVIDYLQENNFKVYIVSGTDRLITRGLCDGTIDIPAAQMIGSDQSFVATNQGDADGLDYTFTHDDVLVTGGDFIIKNLKMNKVSVIEREIGLQPVLCFGNSSGDAAMANYTITGNCYKSASFLLCCDDLDRENGNLSKAESMRQSCEKNGWTAVSMKNDWKTIYGDGVAYSKNNN